MKISREQGESKIKIKIKRIWKIPLKIEVDC